MKKRLFSIILVLVMAVGILPIAAYADFSPTVVLKLDGNPTSPAILRDLSWRLDKSASEYISLKYLENVIPMNNSSTLGTYSTTGPISDGAWNLYLGGQLFYSEPWQLKVSNANPLIVDCYTITYKPGAYGQGSEVKDFAIVTGGNTSYPIKFLDTPFTRENYTQTGWAYSDGGPKIYNLGYSVNPNIRATCDFYAAWTANAYSISYALNGGTVASVNPASYTIESADIPLNNPQRTGYSFVGWTGSNGETAQTSVTIAAGSTGNKSYTANWTAETYNISYTLNGGTVAVGNPADYTIESNTITLSNPTRTGYSFLGWTGSNGETTQTSVTIAAGSTGNKSYIANWKAEAPSSAPLASIVTAKTNASITITTEAGYEYSLNGTNWYSGAGSYTFTDLSSGTAYNLVCRKVAVTTGNTSAASDPSEALSVSTKNGPPSTPTASISSVTANNVTMLPVTGGEYSKDGGSNWQDSNEFAELSAATIYNFAVRIKETSDAVASAISAVVVQYTAAATPGAGEGYTIDFSAETISIDNGYKVSTDSSFASDKLLSNGEAITPGATYYVRKAVDMTTTPNTPASAFASFTVAAKPDAPTAGAYSYDYENEKILFASQYEVFTATSGGSVVTSDSTAITPGGTLYIRVIATSSAPASGWTTITIPSRLETTGLSLTVNRTHATITVGAITCAEYSKDGGTTWQSSNDFTGLNPNAEYDIDIRYAATDSSFASSPLGSVTIKTKTAPGAAPSAPSVSAQTYDSITIDTISGYQYAITTSNAAPTTWEAAETANGTKIFSGLSAATQYYIWVRAAETDTAMPSNLGSKSMYTPASAPLAGEGYTIDYSAETISITSGYEVSANDDFGTTLPSGASVTPGATYYVRKAENAATPASAAVSLALPSRPQMPAATGHTETVSGKNDGKISGVTVAMEWKDAGGTYAAVTTDQASNGITELSDGTYYVRYMAVGDTGFKSAEQEITIAAGHTITVAFDSQSGSDVAAIIGKVYGDSATAPADPTRSGFYFAGWYREAACKNAWTFTLDTLTDNITLFAKWSAIPTYTVTGRIVNDISQAVEGATVKILQGATQYGTTGVTDTNGDFAIDTVPPGIYNLVITKATKTAIIKVAVSNGNVAIGNAALPAGNANSILVVNGSNTPSVVVGGLDSEAGAQLADSGDPHADIVEITLTVEQ